MVKQNQQGEKFTKEELSELKEDMEVEVGARLSKITFSPKIKIVCKNRPGDCPFEYVYAPVDEQNFILESYSVDHLEECYFDEETKCLHKQMLLLIRSKSLIETILRSKLQEGILQKLQPKKLLPTLLMSETGSVFNLYGTVTSQDSRRKLKKKFDNIVNDIKANLLNKKKPKKSLDEESKMVIAIHEQSIGKPCKQNKEISIAQTRQPSSITKPQTTQVHLPFVFDIPNKTSISKRAIVYNIQFSPRLQFPTACSRQESPRNYQPGFLIYDMTPPRLMQRLSFRHIFDSSPRMLRSEFSISD